MILVREVSRQEPYGREVYGPILEPLEDDRELPDGAGGLDAAVGRMPGEVENLRTIREQRGVAFGKVQAAFV